MQVHRLTDDGNKQLPRKVSSHSFHNFLHPKHLSQNLPWLTLRKGDLDLDLLPAARARAVASDGKTSARQTTTAPTKGAVGLNVAIATARHAATGIGTGTVTETGTETETETEIGVATGIESAGLDKMATRRKSLPGTKT